MGVDSMAGGPMIDERRRCTAKSKHSGQRCRRSAVPGKRVCRWHGGLSTGPRTAAGKAASSRNALKHGVYVERTQSAAEQGIFDTMVRALCEEFGLIEPSERLRAEATSMAFVQVVRAQAAKNARAAEAFSQAFRRHMKRLRATTTASHAASSEQQVNPAERATALLAKTRQVGGAGRKK